MFGIVLWTAVDGRKAAIWCEDHGDLAFLEDEAAACGLDVGDMVRLTTEIRRSIRCATKVIRLGADGAPATPCRHGDHCRQCPPEPDPGAAAPFWPDLATFAKSA